MREAVPDYVILYLENPRYQMLPKGGMLTQHEYIAPPEDGRIFENTRGVKYSDFSHSQNIGIYFDIIDHKRRTPRLNIYIRTREVSVKGKPINNVYTNGPRKYWGAERFAELIGKLRREHEFDHIRMLTDYSANGGENSFAAQLAIKTGLPVTGFRGEVRLKAVKVVQQAAIGFSPYPTPMNYQRRSVGGRPGVPLRWLKIFTRPLVRAVSIICQSTLPEH
ncbi:hypothetical protein QLQ11_08085 [Ochrobactrum sp. SSR]|uniref:hypothetical protein n=1 Tax=Ochrobactrum sp. SSR TaxID=3045176 RepID=UPI00279DED97|nr:hypothetical protein QLQ11_08085 [Ochrobactrum sp. SSR]